MSNKGSSKERQMVNLHGGCADLLMSSYGVPKHLRLEVCKQLVGVWKQNTMIHALIVASVNGAVPNPATRALEIFLERHGTHENKHHKSNWGRQNGQDVRGGTFDSKGYFHPSSPNDDW